MLEERVPAQASTTDLLDTALPFAAHWRMLIAAPLVAATAAFGLSFLLPNTYTSRTVFLPPQQQQQGTAITAAAVAQLGALTGLGGSAATMKNPADQYVALMQSANVVDRLIDEFDLMSVYDLKFRDKARERFARNTTVSLGRKDGLITVEFEDRDPQRAAAIANRHVDELRRLISQLALTEAQQRRAFFESQLAQTRERLIEAEEALQASGFSQGALRVDARASAESYARLRAEATAAEVRLQTLRRNLSETTPEVQQAASALSALRAQLQKLEATDLGGTSAYVRKFREFKYQETLFELLARQYELARVDESREGALIQVVDVAQPAERKSHPRRALIAGATWFGTLIALAAFIAGRHAWRRATADPERGVKVDRLTAALRGRPHDRM
jgi:uncharacterized protein involved in exopolysaccharide biosynthesis